MRGPDSIYSSSLRVTTAEPCRHIQNMSVLFQRQKIRMRDELLNDLEQGALGRRREAPGPRAIRSEMGRIKDWSGRRVQNILKVDATLRSGADQSPSMHRSRMFCSAPETAPLWIKPELAGILNVKPSIRLPCGLVVQRAKSRKGDRAFNAKPRQPPYSRNWCFTPLPGSGWQVLFDSKHGSIGCKIIGLRAKIDGATAKTQSTEKNRKVQFFLL
jgi:hypothetical protein